MTVQLWTTKIQMPDEDENDVEDTSGYEKSGVYLHDWVGKTKYRSNHMPDWDLYLP